LEGIQEIEIENENHSALISSIEIRKKVIYKR
jgi:hypothetical protein